MADDDLFDDDDWGGDPYADAGSAAKELRPERKAPGRPKGSLNRKTKEFEAYFQAKGFRDPLVGMAQFITADPVALQAWIQKHEQAEVSVGKEIRTALPTLMDIIKEQHTIATQLAPYLHGKKPVELAIIDERLPALIIDLGTNQLEQGETIAGRKALSLGAPLPEKANEINDPEDDEA